MTEDEKITLISLVSRIDERLKVVEKVIYGVLGVLGGGLVLALLALILKRPPGG